MVSTKSGSSASNRKPWRWAWSLTLYLRWRTINSNRNPLIKFTSSSRSTEFKDIFPWNISQMITKTVPISTRIVISDETVHPLSGLTKTQLKQTVTWSEFPNEGKAMIEQILASEERKKYKREGLWKSQSGIGVVKLTIWARPFEME